MGQFTIFCFGTQSYKQMKQLVCQELWAKFNYRSEEGIEGCKNRIRKHKERLNEQ